MHIRKTLAIGLALTVFTAPPALAVQEGEVYLGVGLSGIEVDYNLGRDIESNALVGRIGYAMTDNFSIEGRKGFGILDNNDIDGARINGGYLIGQFPVKNKFYVYGLAGITVVKAEIYRSLNGGNVTTIDKSGFSYGIGAEADFTNAVSGYVEFAHYLEAEVEGEDFDITNTMVGIRYSF